MKLRLWLVADHIHGDNKWNPTLSARSWPNSIFFFFDSLRSLSLDNLTVSTFCWPIVDSVNFSSNKQLVIVRSSSTYNLVITQKLHNSKERICIYMAIVQCSLLFINIMSVFIFLRYTPCLSHQTSFPWALKSTRVKTTSPCRLHYFHFCSFLY